MSEQTPADAPAHRYTATLAAAIEKRWQDRWEAEGTFHSPNPSGPLAAPTPGWHNDGGKPLYVMDMFPYPSGAGLHVGHPLGYIGTDVFARYHRMLGFNVLHPMGFDAFGLPAEQYAVQTGTHPRKTTEENIERYRAQLRRLGFGHDSRRLLATTDISFYRWTQWIFLQIYNSWYDEKAGRARPIAELEEEFEAGHRVVNGAPWAELSRIEQRKLIDSHRLAYLSEAPVNWCPGLGTVLANEEVTADGRSERGNFPVFKRRLRQWMMRITAYADRLADDLDEVDWPESIKLMQRNWIGRSTGAYIDFHIAEGAPKRRHSAPNAPIRVFTTRPDTVFGATYLVVAPEHPLLDAIVADEWPADTPSAWKTAEDPSTAVAAYQAQAAAKSDIERSADARKKTGVFTGAYAINPVNGERVPVFVADYVLTGYGTGAIMAVPGQDERDWEFAEVFDLPIVRTVQPTDGFDGKAFTGDGPAINSGFLDGLGVADAKREIINWLVENGHGEATTTYKLRDWLFSRQRYWGEPFPIVYDTDGLPVALPDDMLAVELPEIDDYSPRTFDPDDANTDPEPPLARAEDWVNVTLDLGDGPKQYRRETNTMPQWAGSCWYELRYLDPTDENEFVSPANEQYWMGPDADKPAGGVDLYVGGVEHAVLHLLYARFWHKMLFDLGHLRSSEPFGRLFNQGYIQAYAYTDARGTYVAADEVVEADGGYRFHGEPVNREYGKMGKSLKNVVTPDDMCAEYGADTFRVYEMSMGPLDVSRPWETRAVVGSMRFLQRLWRTAVDEESGALRVTEEPADDETRRLLHRTIDGIRGDLEGLRTNTAVSKLIELTNHVTSAYGSTGTPREVVEPMTLMVAPFAPHLAEELWEKLGHGETLTYHPFPAADPALLTAPEIEYPVQVNGKVRGRITVPADADEAAVRAAAVAEPKVAAILAGAEPRKLIVVPGRIVTIVV
ncbi:leucine--tRNA ligase [Cryptosporangium phraense]|uniref:Leucine--tRNA ligase n=1 Tax=Cryptosporangium phraense TaxID=2593070 RepID=A0A545AK48_9ACTN|nr:leucine--tRNA ligase [Cryptosporangium phraense]TQS41707.1 leucine--tRNA ligase [Cryptosporangium phraense]